MIESHSLLSYYWFVRVKEWKVNNQTRWVVDGRVDGKRKRLQFDTKKQAETWLKAEKKDINSSAWWSDLSHSVRADIINAFTRAKDDGFNLVSAVEHYSVLGRDKTFLKKCTLGEAIGDFSVDRRFKKHRNGGATPSGFLAAKLRKGCTQRSLFSLRSVTHNFRDYLGADTQVANITPEMIESWLDAGGVKEDGSWENSTKEGYNRQIKNLFNWMIKRDYVKENPASKIEDIILGEYEPQILSVDQVVRFLEITRQENSALLSPAALNLFCGIRPSEVRRMTQANISIADKEVELKGRQTKTRRKRYVEMSDNCIAWMKLGAELPIVNQNHQWDTLMVKVKAELGYDKWPHDCLRHSFCSYYLAHHENAAKTALQAGHTESILFRHYRKLVKKEQAEKFWNIFPEKLAA